MQKLKQNKRLKRFLLPLLVLAFMFIPIGSVLAESVSGDNVVIESNETLEKTSFLSGQNIRVDGDINGTTFITGGTIEVNGTIDGDLFIAGQSATINGTVKGSIFLVGQDMSLKGLIENSVYSVGQSLKMLGQTNGSAFIAGQNILVENEAIIERDVFVGSSTLTHNGKINGDLKSSGQSLTIGGTIGGDLNYSSQNQANFLNTSEVLGETTWKKVEPRASERSKSLFTVAVLTRALISLAAAFVIWLFIRWIRPTFWPNLADKIEIHPLKTLGFGALALIFTPIVSILLMFTIIGIPLSLIILTLYGVALYISKIILAVYLSHYFKIKLNWSDGQTFWLFLLTLIILTGLGVIPIIGMILGFLTASLGLGAIGFAITENREQLD